MTLRFATCLLALALTPGVAGAQSARNANVWDGQAHQPTAGVADRERQAGVAPPAPDARAQQEDLDRIGKQLTDKAAKDSTIPHTVQPGGVVPVPSQPETASSPSR